MQELLSRTDDPKAPLCGQEFYELRFYESESEGRRVYCVREAHAQWSDMDGQIMWDEDRVRAFATHKEAEERYSERKLALAERGFIYSDTSLL
jgi:hypothetical protein